MTKNAPSPQIVIDNTISLMDKPINISFKGLNSNQKYRIVLKRRSVTLQNIIYRKSEADFIADENGCIFLDKQSPISGSYSVIDPMGLFWSMEIIEKRENINEPYVKLAPHEFQLIVEQEGFVIAEESIIRLWHDPNILSTPVRENGLVGTLFHQQNSEPRPGIIILGGSEGGIYEFPAGLLASHGFNVLALGYFGIESLPDQLVNIPLEYIKDAIHWMLDRNDVFTGWLGIHGTSRGGELALWSASIFPEIKAVVSLNGSSISYAGIVPWSDSPSLPPAWIFKDKPLPYASPKNPVEIALACKEMWYRNENPLPIWYNALCSDRDVLENAIIPVENIQGEILLISGEKDANFDSEWANMKAIQRLKRYNHPYAYKQVVYPGAGHEISFPYIPILANTFFGGNKKDTVKASKDSWFKTITFFKDSFYKTTKISIDFY